MVDFTPEGEAALELAAALNARNGNQIDSYIGSMTPGEFDREVLDADPVVLFASLEARPAAQMLNAMDEDQTKAFLEGRGGDGLSLFLDDLSHEEMTTFVNSIAPDALEATVDHVGLDSIMARSEDVSNEVASTLERKLQHTSYREEDDDPDRKPPDDNTHPTATPTPIQGHLGRTASLLARSIWTRIIRTFGYCGGIATTSCAAMLQAALYRVLRCGWPARRARCPPARKVARIVHARDQVGRRRRLCPVWTQTGRQPDHLWPRR